MPLFTDPPPAADLTAERDRHEQDAAHAHQWSDTARGYAQTLPSRFPRPLPPALE
jgi:hypothetical protein